MRIYSWQFGGAHGVLHWPAAHKTKVKRHWLRGFYWWMAFIMVSLITANILIYLLMSYATLPYTYVNGVNIGAQSRTSTVATLNEVSDSQPLEVNYEGVVHEFTLGELGITIDAGSTFREFRRVEGFASLPMIKALTNPFVNVLPSYDIDRDKTIAMLSEIVKPEKVEPVSAKMIIPYLDGQPLEITASENGYEISPEIIADRLIARVRRGSTLPKSFSFAAGVLRPELIESDFLVAQLNAEELLASEVQVNDINDKLVTTVSSRALRSLLTTTSDGDLSFNEELLKNYIREELGLYFFTSPVHKRVDGGKVTAKGKAGVQLDVGDAYSVFMDDVLRGASPIQLKTLALEPVTVTNGVYPKTETGLQALIRDFDIEKSGDYRIIVHQLRGGDMRATHKGEISSIPASTYKAFIAYAAMWAAEQGEITLQDQTSRGTVDACMYEMLHYSTDFCAFAIQDYMGWQRIDDILHQAGFENTKLNNEDRFLDKYTTAQDEFKLYKGLYDGTLLNKQHTERLLTRLKQQIWRSGIPGGSSPSVVADKVGFYNGWINDVGIVYGTKADYIIIALSDGGSFWEINDLSRRIYNFFEQ